MFLPVYAINAESDTTKPQYLRRSNANFPALSRKPNSFRSLWPVLRPELLFLKGKDALKKYEVHSLIQY
ncbi:MAG: hypothetical protein A2901_01705 [Elusimicrobia bacterium RIFCSPLOWO2_01_FULL_54_10]|nr:MAG: hypothetical protein A2901_01705 [Elusimicrobia bacterium RIFCSPLOWO2_01_FULL_54_10]